MKNLSVSKKVGFAVLSSILFLSFTTYLLMPPGLDNLEPIGEFIDGNLPSSAPQTDIQLTPVLTGLDWESPQALLPFPGTNRLLIVEMDGRFFTVRQNDNATDRVMVMDIRDRCWYYDWTSPGTKHGGFQNAVFHPEFGQGNGNDYIYVYYVRHVSDNNDLDSRGPYYDRLSRFTWTGNSFDPDSELIMINQYDTSRGHDGSGLAFGADGFLYVSVGDEGSQNGAATRHTQRINDRFRSGVWRIDVDRRGGNISHPIRRQPNNANVPSDVQQSFTQGYFIPNDNPWIDETGGVLEEFYAIGLRQPFRMTYDAPSGNFWIGDVGGSQREEVNIMDRPGLNYQWNYKKGNQDGFRPRPEPFIGEDRPPAMELTRPQGRAIIGGYIYRGSRFPQLFGKYVFGDNGIGEVYHLTHEGGNRVSNLTSIGNVGGGGFSGISSIGKDHSNELYVLKLSRGTPGGGTIFKLTPGNTIDEQLPSTLSQTGIFTNMQNLTTAPGIIPYEVNSPLWSAGTVKKRWVSIPNDGNPNTAAERIAYSANGPWGMPVGTVFIKHFETPEGRKLETRLWVHGENGDWFGSSYRWRANGREADLLLSGATETLTIENETFTYEYPSSSQCISCHNNNAGSVLECLY